MLCEKSAPLRYPGKLIFNGFTQTNTSKEPTGKGAQCTALSTEPTQPDASNIWIWSYCGWTPEFWSPHSNGHLLMEDLANFSISPSSTTHASLGNADNAETFVPLRVVFPELIN